jgi:ParB-like chromosome segregation protein Spo0J
MSEGPFRTRIKSLRHVKANELIANDLNWRLHPQAQREALSGLFEEVGFAGAVLVREREDGKLVIVDGHLRAEEAGDQKIPVLVTDLDEAEAKLVLASFDPIGAMASVDKKALKDLLLGLEATSEAAVALLDQIAQANKITFDELAREAKATLALDALDVPALPTSGVRMVQLFLNDKTIDDFHAMVDVLGSSYGTENATDTVYECLKRAYAATRQ